MICEGIVLNNFRLHCWSLLFLDRKLRLRMVNDIYLSFRVNNIFLWEYESSISKRNKILLPKPLDTSLTIILYLNPFRNNKFYFLAKCIFTTRSQYTFLPDSALHTFFRYIVLFMWELIWPTLLISFFNYSLSTSKFWTISISFHLLPPILIIYLK